MRGALEKLKEMQEKALIVVGDKSFGEKQYSDERKRTILD